MFSAHGIVCVKKILVFYWILHRFLFRFQNLKSLKENQNLLSGWAQWCVLLIPVPKKLRQEDCHVFEVNLHQKDGAR